MAKIHAIACFQPKVAAILNRGHPYMKVPCGTYNFVELFFAGLELFYG